MTLRLVASALPGLASTGHGELHSRIGRLVQHRRADLSIEFRSGLHREFCRTALSSDEPVETTDRESTLVQLPESELPSVEERFRMADVDGNGRIDEAELQSLLESVEGGKAYLLGHWLPEAEVKDMMHVYDTDESGDISFQEFVGLVSDDRLLNGTLSEYEEAFEAVDTSGNNSIGFSELSRLLTNLGQGMPDDKLTETFNKYDLDASGQIEFEEFLMMFRDRLLDLRQVLDYIRLSPERGEGPPSRSVGPSLVDLGPAGQVTTIFGEDELNEVLTREESKLVVLFAGLSWCRPCKAATRPYQRIADRYRSAVFLKMLGNANASTKHLFKNRLEVTATPAFFFFRGGDLVSSHTGASKVKLETNLITNLKPEERPPEGPVHIQL